MDRRKRRSDDGGIKNQEYQKFVSIRAEHLSHIYNEGTVMETYAVRDVSFEIADGTFVGLIGHTGSGKSTLIQHLNGLVKPSRGTVYFNDEDIFADGYDLRGLRGHVGLVFQYPEYQLFEEDVLTDVMFGPKNMGLTEEEAKARAVEALHQVGITDEIFVRSPFELSGGQKRRVAVAGVIAMQPSVLILDEPTAGPGANRRPEHLRTGKRLSQERSMTVGFVAPSVESGGGAGAPPLGRRGSARKAALQ